MLVDASVWVDAFDDHDCPQAQRLASLCIRDAVPLLTKDRDFRAIARSTPLLLVES